MLQHMSDVEKHVGAHCNTCRCMLQHMSHVVAQAHKLWFEVFESVKKYRDARLDMTATILLCMATACYDWPQPAMHGCGVLCMHRRSLLYMHSHCLPCMPMARAGKITQIFMYMYAACILHMHGACM